MKWSKLGSVALFILGLIPYFGIGYIVTELWLEFIIEPDIFLSGWTWLPWGHSMGYYVRYILETLTVMGSWLFWWLFCKVFKYTVIWRD